jgi:PKD repeat protein
VNFSGSVTPSDLKACGEHSASFVSTVSGGQAPYTYAWEFGDFSQGHVANPSHVYGPRDKYSVTLTVGDAIGQTVKVTKVLDAVGFVACYPSGNPQSMGPAAGGVQDGTDATQGQSDFDGDGVPNAIDNCPSVSNADQTIDFYDAGRNPSGLGNACNPDLDNDGIANAVDNCPTTQSTNLADFDSDGMGDACDPDVDGDGVGNTSDDCPTIPNASQTDSNDDGTGDACQLTTSLDAFAPAPPAKSVDPARASSVRAPVVASNGLEWLAAAATVGGLLLVAAVLTVTGARRRQ